MIMVIKKYRAKKGDVYLTANELAEMFGVRSHDVYMLRNEKRLKKTITDGHYHLDEVRELLKIDGLIQQNNPKQAG